MKIPVWFLIFALEAVLVRHATAQISVGLGGTSAIRFDSAPVLPASQWATYLNPDNTGLGADRYTYTSSGELAAAVQTLNQGSVTSVLERITENFITGVARHNIAGGYLITEASDFGAVVLKGTLRNVSGQPIKQITVSYNFGVVSNSVTETIPGQLAFFSTTGFPNSWQAIPQFSGLNSPAFVSATLFLGTWMPGTDIYFLWADDNSEENPDGAYTIDNFSVSNVVLALPSNVAPVLTPIGTKYVEAGKTLTFSAMASDSDSPPQTLTFSLSNAPAGAVISPSTGLFTWTPVLNQVGTNVLEVRVTDSGSPSFQDFEPISIVVSAPHISPGTVADLRLSKGGVVNAMALQSDGQIVIGGLFTSVNDTPLTNLARINTAGGVDVNWAPNPDGPVFAIATSGTNVFVGGRFTYIGEQFRNGLALVLMSGHGEVVSNFAPMPSVLSGTPMISALAVSGGNLFAGGRFDFLGPSNIANLAKISLAGVVNTTWVPNPNAAVNTLAINGASLHAGGEFTQIGGLTRNRLAKLSTAGSGVIDSTWIPNIDSAIPSPSTNSSVRRLLLVGTNLFASGRFTNVNGTSRFYLAKMSANGSALLDASWDPHPFFTTTDPGALAMAASSTNLFVGGQFIQIGGRARTNIARISLTGLGDADTNWVPQINAPVNVLLPNGSWLFAGGEFSLVNDIVLLGATKLDLVLPVADENFSAQFTFPGIVHALIRQSDGRIILGGDFWLAGQEPRPHLARVFADGTLDFGWAPATDGPVNALALEGNNLFVGGLFKNIKGQRRNSLAKVDTITDLVDTNWNPAISSSAIVYALATNLGSLLIGGKDLGINGAASNSLGRVGTSGTGVADTNWSAIANGPVRAIATSQTNIFVGGEFTSIRGQARSGVAKFLTTAGGALNASWIVTITNPAVHALAANGSDLYVGGAFFAVNGVTREGVAKVNGVSGVLDASWNASSLPDPVSDIYALTAFAKTGLYLEGAFAGNQANLVRLQGDGSVDTSWQPNAFGTNSSTLLLGAILLDGQNVIAGGPFQSIGGFPRNGFALLPQLDAPIMSKTSPSNFVVFASASDGSEVTHFRITSIDGGVLLYLGTRQLFVGDFITVAQGAGGVVFVGTNGSVTMVAATSDTANGAGGVSTTLNLATVATPLFALGSPTYFVTENGSSVSVSVLKFGSGTASVSYSTTDQTAINGIHYFGVSGTLFFTNQTSRTISIPIFDNSLSDGSKAFRIDLSSPSGAALGSPVAATVTISDDESMFSKSSYLTNRLPTVLPPSTGGLLMYLQPLAANGRWRLAGQSDWKTNGAAITNLVTGIYQIEFQPVSGYRAPDSMIAMVNSGSTLVLTNTYILNTVASGPGVGYLSLLIAPNDVASNGVVAMRGQWRRAGTVNWFNSGEAETNLNPGTYRVEFKDVTNYATPPAQDLVVFAEEGTRITGDYCHQSESVGTPPSVVSFQQATTNRQFLYAGQLQTGLGFGSGAVVRENTVLTSAHLLFDAANLTYVSDARWFYQRYAGSYEPPAQLPRGWQVMSSYAAQRQLDNTPGEQSLQSLEMDVAAVYSFEPSGRGGAGGYLVSDATTNWLLTSRMKRLVGYPMDGVSIANQGMLFATTASNLTFVQTATNIYSTTQIRGFPGLAGAPLYVAADDGNYYPAAVYLGPCQASATVRVLDSVVAELISRADFSGVARLSVPLTKALPKELVTSVSAAISTNVGNFNRVGTGIAFLQVNTGPTGALATTVGGGWQLGRASTATFHRGTSEQEPVYGSVNADILFRCISGFALPVRKDVSVAQGATYIIDRPYLSPPPSPALKILPIQPGSAKREVMFTGGLNGYTYEIQFKSDLRETDWKTVTRSEKQVLDQNPVLVPDPDPPSTAGRFYRVIWKTCPNQ